MQQQQRVCNGKLIFRRYRKSKTGVPLDARKFGYKAWPICIGEWVEKEKAVLTSTT